ncbi:DUF2690 domain-containing protein [Nocardiopsis halophila]|uniref:DUF2690 domain-containing protein n=1 Tax=Nocardiopsis halophila TaxID=141692 RepID=UPI00034C3B14|nr:DUF2690 domain-containing protein [Nocardiopsis halophila]
MPIPPTRRKLRSRIAAPLAVAAGAVLGAAVLTASPAAADSTVEERGSDGGQVHAQHMYDGADPQATGCSSGATTVRQNSRDGMTFQLRWSPSCQTNWVRILGYPGNIPAPQRDGLWMDVADLDREVFETFDGGTSLSGTRWGNMVYSPGTNCARGAVNYKDGSAPGWNFYDVVLYSTSC